VRRALLIAAAVLAAAVAWHGCVRTLELGLAAEDAAPGSDAGDADGGTAEMARPDTGLDAPAQDGSNG
jgi:hypothetical protein